MTALSATHTPRSAPSGRLATLAAAALGLLGLAAPAAAQKVGTTSFQFLKVMPVARASAMGDAYAAAASGAEALFWNPAGLALGGAVEVTATHIPYVVDTRLSSAGVAVPLGGAGSVGVQLQFVDYGELVETQAELLGFNPDGTFNPGLTGQTFSPTALAVGVSYARSLTDQFSTGLTAKYVYESLYSGGASFADPTTGETYQTSAGALLFDFGIQYATGFRSLRLGAAVQNFGPEVAFVGEGFAAPLTFRLGASGDLVGRDGILLPDGTNRMTVAYDLVQPNDYDQQMQVGVEYAFADVLAVRAGRKLNYDTEGWTFGAGLRAALLRGTAFSFDYTYAEMGSDLGVAHRLTVGARLP